MSHLGPGFGKSRCLRCDRLAPLREDGWPPVEWVPLEDPAELGTRMGVICPNATTMRSTIRASET